MWGVVTTAEVTAGHTLAWPLLLDWEREREFYERSQRKKKKKKKPKKTQNIWGRVLYVLRKYKGFLWRSCEKAKATCCGKSFFFFFNVFVFVVFVFVFYSFRNWEFFRACFARGVKWEWIHVWCQMCVSLTPIL